MVKMDIPNIAQCYKTQTAIIPIERIPETIDLGFVVSKFGKHSHHWGHFVKDDTFTHVVRDVVLNNQGGLNVTFNFVHTLCGEAFMYEYLQGDDFEMVPVLDRDQTTITRFDFKR